MKIAEFSVKNYQFTIIIFIMIMAIGVNSLLTMPKAEDPVLKATYNTIIVIYPGASAADMEKLVVDPIEEKMGALSEVKQIMSKSDDGVASITVRFEHNIDPDEKYNEVLRELNALKSKLPQDIYSTDIYQFTPESVSIVQCAIMSETAPYKDLEKHAEDLKERLLKIKALRGVEIWAYPKQKVNVSINLEKMAQFKIPFSRVFSLIQSENMNIPAGTIEIGNRNFNVKTSGSYQSLDEIRNTVVSSSGTQITYLKDIAEVNFDNEEENYMARLNGKRGIFVTATQKVNTNIFDINNEMSPILESYDKTLPSSIKFEKNFDQAKGVSKRLLGLAKDFGIAILLVLFTLIPLGFRASLVVMISIPLSLAIGLFGLDFLGYGINQLSVVGFVIALGLLVDDSIVVVENIARFLREGHSRKDAAIEATKQIGLAVVGCTATLIFAFLPLLFLPESSGDFIRTLPLAVITTVLASLFVSITIVPFLASLIMPRETHEDGNVVLRVMKKLIEGSYRKILHASLRNPIITLAIAIAIFAGSVAMIPVIGISVFPKSDKPMFLINISTPLGTKLSETDKTVRFVEKELSKHPVVQYYSSNIGKENPRIYYNLLPSGGTSSNLAQILVQLQEETQVTERSELIAKLRNSFQNFAGAKIKVIEFEQGPPIEAPLAVRIFGENLDTLRALSFKVENAYKNTEGTIYVNNPMSAINTDIKVNINKDKAGMMGIPVAEIDRTIRMGITGISAGSLKQEGKDEIDINIGIKKEDNVAKVDIFNKIFVASQAGMLLPLSQLATFGFEKSPTKILHHDQNRYTSVSAFVADGFLTPEVNKQFQEKLAQIKLPVGYEFETAGEVEQKKESFGGLGTIILVTIFGIMAVLILEFKTFKSTFIVLSVIPLGVIGAVAALYFSGNTLSFTAIVGLIALAGIEVKNSILLVDFTNYLRKEEGLSIDEAIEKAGETRFIPIVLTTLTAIGGLIPLVMEHSPLFSPLALVIIGGLISSLILTRIVTPVMYKLLPPKV